MFPTTNWIAFLLPLLLLPVSCGAPQERDFEVYGVASSVVAEIERHVQMPSGSTNLREYDRYYSRAAGADVVQAIYLRRGSMIAQSRPQDAVPLQGVANAFATLRLPVVFDGMCAVVNADFHLSPARFAPQASRKRLPLVQAQQIACGGI